MSKNLIYADHAATTQLCDAAWAAMTPFLREEFGNPSSLHSRAKTPREAVSAARATIAACIGAEPGEIVFTSGGTESDNWVIKGTGGVLMVSAYEHHAVLNAAASEESCGRKVVYVRPKVGGYLMPETLTKRWEEGIGLVSVMMANNEIGTINPIKLLAEFAHKRGALFIRMPFRRSVIFQLMFGILGLISFPQVRISSMAPRASAFSLFARASS